MAEKKAISSTKKSTGKASTSASNTNSSAASTYDTVRKTLKEMPLIGALVAEFIGAFLLTAAFIEMQGSPLFVAFALGGIVLIVGGVSGAHVNPAVTIGAWVTRKMNWVYALGYIVAQLLGATVAYLVLNTFLHGSTTTAAGAAAPTLLHAATIVKGKEWYIFFTELLGTTILVLGVATALRHRKNRIVFAFSAAFAITIALYVALTLNTSLLQSSADSNAILTFLNPAIAFAANGLAWSAWPLVIYVLAPVLGGIAGFAIQDFLHSQDKTVCDCDDCQK
ncbi:MAG TPA: aquaporin [Candidatus Saccharimonadales bacterium]|nr:aquaporin [Candidatus Saccharimonadales bacterium]